MNLYTKAVQYIQDYITNTEPVLTEGTKTFPEIKTQLDFAMEVLKSNAFYEEK